MFGIPCYARLLSGFHNHVCMASYPNDNNMEIPVNDKLDSDPNVSFQTRKLESDECEIILKTTY
jgi:hypothetical protein